MTSNKESQKTEACNAELKIITHITKLHYHTHTSLEEREFGHLLITCVLRSS